MRAPPPAPVDRAADPREASARIRSMFDRIARRYDSLNRVLSAGTDRRWRRLAADATAVGPGDAALDVATGTGDLGFDLAARGARVVGVDFSGGMLRIALRKVAERGATGVSLLRASADGLPFAEGAFAAAAVAFGVRNFPDRPGALAEMRRVVRPGGRVVVLELALPRSRFWRRVYAPYFACGLPAIGAALSDRSAYRYLRDSVAAFPERDEFQETMRRAGLREVSCRDLTGGLAAIYTGVR